MASMYDPEAVGNIIGVSTVTLFHWRKNSIGPEWFKRGQFYYYPAEKLEAYLDRIGPIPEGMNLREKRRYFAAAHRPKVTPEDTPVTPEHKATLAELAERIVSVEVELAKIKTRKRRRNPRDTAARIAAGIAKHESDMRRKGLKTADQIAKEHYRARAPRTSE